MFFCIPVVIAKTGASMKHVLAVAHFFCLGNRSQKRLVALLSCSWGKEQLWIKNFLTGTDCHRVGGKWYGRRGSVSRAARQLSLELYQSRCLHPHAWLGPWEIFDQCFEWMCSLFPSTTDLEGLNFGSRVNLWPLMWIFLFIPGLSLSWAVGSLCEVLCRVCAPLPSQDVPPPLSAWWHTAA